MNMKHTVRTDNGYVTIEMGCNHPNMKGNSTASVGCSGKCEECKYSIAYTTIPEMLKLIRAAEQSRGD